MLNAPSGTASPLEAQTIKLKPISRQFIYCSKQSRTGTGMSPNQINSRIKVAIVTRTVFVLVMIWQSCTN